MAATRIRIRITEHGLEARASMTAGEPATLADLLAALRSAGVVCGFDVGACGRLAKGLADPAFVADDVLVARAIATTAGTDGRLALEDRSTGQPASVSDADQTLVDGLGAPPGAGRASPLHALDAEPGDVLTPVRPGDRVARYEPPSGGEPGRTVTGEAIAPSRGRDTLPALGDGVAIAHHGEIRALRPGVVRYVPGHLLDVVSHHEHRGDVDQRSGDLFSEGSLTIRGSVRRNLVVRAGGDVEVKGDVDHGSVLAEGNVTVVGGVIGGETGRVSAEGSVTAHHAQAARMQCRGVIAITAGAHNSALRAARIRIGERLVGGTTEAETLVAVGEAGTPRGTETSVAAAVVLEWEADVARATARSSWATRTAARRSERGGRGRAKGGKAARQAQRLDEAELGRLLAHHRRRQELLAEARIELGLAHPGVTVHLGRERLEIKQPLSQVRFLILSKPQRIYVEHIQ